MLTVDEIMDRLLRLNNMGVSLRCRSTFPSGPSKWYVEMSGIRSPGGLWEYNGKTPEEAIRRTWEYVTSEKARGFPFVRYFCKPDESVPGTGPQVWVRWNEKKDDWEDVTPSENDWWAKVASEIIPYSHYSWAQRVN